MPLVEESKGREARLMALQLQLNRHFLLNVLNTLSSLIATGAYEEAEEVIINLSTLLRSSLAGGTDARVPLREEIEILRVYLEIEARRFADRLTFVQGIPDSCGRALVPGLILQPLVENVVRHALASSLGAVTLTLGAERRDGQLRLWVENSPPTVPVEGATSGSGTGLRNVRDRLDAFYGEDAAITIGPTAAGGWRCDLELPWAAGDSG